MIIYKSEKEDTVASCRGGRGCISSRGCIGYVVSSWRRGRQVERRVCGVCVNSTASRCVSGAKQGGCIVKVVMAVVLMSRKIVIVIVIVKS